MIFFEHKDKDRNEKYFPAFSLRLKNFAFLAFKKGFFRK